MIRIVRYAELPDVPWKNGGGTMREIARAEGTTMPDWSLGRALVAQDGPFSRFDDMVRILTVVEGAGMRLIVGAEHLEADLLRPLRFDGATPTMAHLRNGPVSPFNLMFDPRTCNGRVEVLRGPLKRELNVTSAYDVAVHTVSGTVRIGSHDLHTDDTAICGSNPVRLELGSKAVALLTTITRQE